MNNLEFEYIRLELHHQHAMLHEILRALVPDPAKLATVTADIAKHTEALKAAVTAATPPPT